MQRIARAAVIVLSVCCLCPGQETGRGEEAVRLWVNKYGTAQLMARFIGTTNGVVLLQSTSGTMHQVPLDQLSKEDRAYAEQAARKVVAGLGDETTEVFEEIPTPRPEAIRSQAPPARRSAARSRPRSQRETSSTLQLPGILKSIAEFANQARGSGSDQSADRKERRTLFDEDASVYVALSGRFLNELIRVPIMEDKEVVDVILGTPVAGDARTHGTATIELASSADKAAFDIVVTGFANSTTTGFQSLVNVHSEGTTHFHARKRITFDAHGIRHYQATAQADTRVHRSGVSTQLPGVIGRLVGRIAGEVVASNRVQIDMAASDRAAIRAARDLDSRVNSELNRWLPLLRQVAPKPLKRHTARSFPYFDGST